MTQVILSLSWFFSVVNNSFPEFTANDHAEYRVTESVPGLNSLDMGKNLDCAIYYPELDFPYFPLYLQ
jgi:hypothetical protein